MRAVLVTNPFATKTNAEVISSIVELLQTKMSVKVCATSARDDAMELAKGFTNDKYDLVISLGGDGTANEIINGLLHVPETKRPSFASLPGGNANVLARNLGFSAKALPATHELLDVCATSTPISMGLGKVHAQTDIGKEFSRYFAFNAGLGIDAEVLLSMHELRNRGRKVSDLTYAALAARRIFSWTKKSTPQLLINGHKLFFAFILNMSPWTYISKRAIDPAPKVTIRNSLSVYAAKSASIRTFTAVLRAMALGKNFAAVPDIVAFENTTDITLLASDPLWLQVDGEPLALVRQARFTYHPDMIKVFAKANPGL